VVGIVDAGDFRSARVLFRGVVVVRFVAKRGVLRDALRLSSWWDRGCGSVHRRQQRCPFAVLTQLGAAGGGGRSSGCALAVEHWHRARVRSETGHAIAGSFGKDGFDCSEGRGRLPKGGLGCRWHSGSWPRAVAV